MLKTITVHDLLKPVKPQLFRSRPQRVRQEVLRPEVVRLQIEIPHKTFQYFRGKDGRGWQKRIAQALVRAAAETE
jgi:uncharacterized protein (DUF4415 family)